MRIKIVWPGKTRDQNIKELQDSYLEKINKLERCELIETKETRRLTKRMEKRILAIEANGLEKHMKGDYIICLFDKGKKMDSVRSITFIVGGFLGLANGILKRAHFLLSLSKMTFSHELTRVVLLEQIYRSLTIMHGRQYAK